MRNQYDTLHQPSNQRQKTLLIPKIPDNKKQESLIMTAPKLRLVFYEDENGPVSYSHLERTEGVRAIAILKALKEIKGWMPVSSISKMIGARLPATINTISKMAGAERIDLRLPEGRKVIAKKPVIIIRKEEYNDGNKQRRLKYLKPTLYVNKHDRKRSGIHFGK